MCFHSLTYYPRKPNFKVCLSIPFTNDSALLLVKLNESRYAQVPDFGDHMQKFRNAVAQTFKTIQTDNFVRETFKEFYNSTRMFGLCSGNFFGPKDQIKPKNTYIQPDLCALPNKTQNGIFHFIRMFLNWILESIIGAFKNIF